MRSRIFQEENRKLNARARHGKNLLQEVIDAPLSEEAKLLFKEDTFAQLQQLDELRIDKINKEKGALQSVIEDYNKNLAKIDSSKELSNRWGKSNTSYAPVCDETIELLGQFLIDKLGSQNATQSQKVNFAEKINAAISDIKIYMNQLGLYDYIKSIYQIRGTYDELTKQRTKVKSDLKQYKKRKKEADKGTMDSEKRRWAKEVSETQQKSSNVHSQFVANYVPYTICAVRIPRRTVLTSGKIAVVAEASAAKSSKDGGKTTGLQLFIKTLEDGNLIEGDSKQYYQPLREVLNSINNGSKTGLAVFKNPRSNNDENTKTYNIHSLRLLQSLIEFDMYDAGELKDDFRSEYYNDWRFNSCRKKQFYRHIRISEQETKDRTFGGKIKLLQEIYATLRS